MKYYVENSLSNFEFWSGAKDRAKVLTESDFDNIEAQLEDLFPEGMSETDINDFFWFEEDAIAQMLGFSDWEELERDHNKEEDDEDEDDSL